MREIKFRAMMPNIENAKEPGEVIKPFVKLYFNLLEALNCEVAPSYEFNLLKRWMASGGIPDQYIGRKDKNDIEIYEGDIVKTEYYTFDDCGNEVTEYIIADVFYDEDCQGFIVNPAGGRIVEICNPEIIGNIYENPEFFKSLVSHDK